jgi:hypothetical protein
VPDTLQATVKLLYFCKSRHIAPHLADQLQLTHFSNLPPIRATTKGEHQGDLLLDKVMRNAELACCSLSILKPTWPPTWASSRKRTDMDQHQLFTNLSEQVIRIMSKF